MTYADNTSVPVERSRAEIERTLSRYGASAFGYMTEAGRAVIMFEAHDRRIRFDLPLPRPDERRFTHTPGRDLERTQKQALDAWETVVAPALFCPHCERTVPASQWGQHLKDTDQPTLLTCRVLHQKRNGEYQ